jgi:hypothetical protein
LVDQTRRDHNKGSLNIASSEQYAHSGNRLHRLTEAHVVGQQQLALPNEEQYAAVLEWVERPRPLEQRPGARQKTLARHGKHYTEAFYKCRPDDRVQVDPILGR